MKILEKRFVQFVVKTSKFCNLRCKYCYEYAELSNKANVSLEQIESMFRNIYNYYSKLDFSVNIEFVWHGGEPLLQLPDFYWKAFEYQQKIFGELADNITNVVQTNLTVIDAERIRLLRDGFNSVGVSIDLYSNLRINQSGIDSHTKVLANMDRLREENITFGCITVLTKLNLPYIREIYDFYKKQNLSFRILPLFDGAFDGQHEGFEITEYEILEAHRTLVDIWLTDETFIPVVPIVDYFTQVLHKYSLSKNPQFYDKNEWESVYLVNTTGDIYSYADAYEIERSHGNIFTTPLEQIIGGEKHQEVIKIAEKKIIEACGDCSYFGNCSGYPIGEGNRVYDEVGESGHKRCIVDRGTLEHIEQRLYDAGIIDSQTGHLNLGKLNLPETPLELTCAL